MAHHINEKGEFQSDKHPDLPPDRIRLNLANPRSRRAIMALADDYEETDPELAADLRKRLMTLYPGTAMPHVLPLENGDLMIQLREGKATGSVQPNPNDPTFVHMGPTGIPVAITVHAARVLGSGKVERNRILDRFGELECNNSDGDTPCACCQGILRVISGEPE